MFLLLICPLGSCQSSTLFAQLSLVVSLFLLFIFRLFLWLVQVKINICLRQKLLCQSEPPKMLIYVIPPHPRSLLFTPPFPCPLLSWPAKVSYELWHKNGYQNNRKKTKQENCVKKASGKYCAAILSCHLQPLPPPIIPTTTPFHFKCKTCSSACHAHLWAFKVCVAVEVEAQSF